MCIKGKLHYSISLAILVILVFGIGKMADVLLRCLSLNKVSGQTIKLNLFVLWGLSLVRCLHILSF